MMKTKDLKQICLKITESVYRAQQHVCVPKGPLSLDAQHCRIPPWGSEYALLRRDTVQSTTVASPVDALWQIGKDTTSVEKITIHLD